MINIGLCSTAAAFFLVEVELRELRGGREGPGEGDRDGGWYNSVLSGGGESAPNRSDIGGGLISSGAVFITPAPSGSVEDELSPFSCLWAIGADSSFTPSSTLTSSGLTLSTDIVDTLCGGLSPGLCTRISPAMEWDRSLLACVGSLGEGIACLL